MPYVTEWVPPDVFLEHNGVTVYYAYEDGFADDPSFYHYAVVIRDRDDPDVDFDGEQFDVRAPDSTGFSTKTREAHREILKRAIERGEGIFKNLVRKEA